MHVLRLRWLAPVIAGLALSLAVSLADEREADASNVGTTVLMALKSAMDAWCQQYTPGSEWGWWMGTDSNGQLHINCVSPQ